MLGNTVKQVHEHLVESTVHDLKQVQADEIKVKTQKGTFWMATKGLFENVLHCSDSEEAAEKEIKLWFQPDEIVEEIYPTKETELKIKTRVWQ